MNEIQQILSGIKGGCHGFPAAQRLVADYVVKNYEQILFLLDHGAGPKLRRE